MCGALSIGSGAPASLLTDRSCSSDTATLSHQAKEAGAACEKGTCIRVMPALAAGGWHHTPARAGSTSVFGEDEAVDESHSRLRGEHRELLHRSPYRGTIPAYAGSTTPGGFWNAPLKDHPRMRGEHRASTRLMDPASGPSPHARGALAAALVTLWRTRTIPACAGSTEAVGLRGVVRGDHPRMRGEHTT